MKEDELNGDLEFIVEIRFGGKSSRSWKTNKSQSWKWKEVCGNYKNPILEFDVRQTSYENNRKTYKTHVVSTTKGGKVWSMD